MCLCYLFTQYLVQKLHDDQWIERLIFLEKESIRIDSNRELECSTRVADWGRKDHAPYCH